MKHAITAFFLFMSFAAAGAEPGSWPETVLVKIASGLVKPTHIANAGDGSGRMFITEQTGRVQILRDSALTGYPFLDIRNLISCCGERGLLSIAFPPRFREKRHFYVNYTDRNGNTVVARYRVSGDPDRADPASHEVVLTVSQPFRNHNGGLLVFGIDGYLYIGMGDGGAAGDPLGHGQNPGSLLGKILRIDVESGIKPYSIPPGNTYRGKRDTGMRSGLWASEIPGNLHLITQQGTSTLPMWVRTGMKRFIIFLLGIMAT